MSWVAVGVAGATLVTGYMANDASKSAAAAQVGASRDAITAQQNQLATTRADNAPFLATGTAANDRLKTLLGLQPGTPKEYKDWTRDDFVNAYKQLFTARGAPNQPLTSYLPEINARIGDLSNPEVVNYFNDIGLKQYGPSAPGTTPDPSQSPLLRRFTADDLAADPVYNAGLKFGLDRGTEGINARATASGMYDSGATLKALTQFGNDYGSTKANESYNRFTNDQNNIFNRLSGVSGTGQVATSQVASAGSNAANNISENLTGAGNARAAGIVGGANAWGTTATNLNNQAMNYQSNKRLDALLAQRQQPYYTGYGSGGDYQYG